jgi:lipid-A-disaccharide synthase
MRVLIIAGEASGDMHAVALMRALRAQVSRPIVFRGIGGDAMRAAGAELLFHADQTAVIGLWDVLRHIRFFAAMMRRMEQEMDVWHPDLVLTVDYPGFNLRFAARAHVRGITTIHYICPQVWAWHRSRIPGIARILDHLIVLFPFEPACFAGTPLKVTFAGHPLVDRAAETWAEPEAPLPWQGARYRVALLPGSRRGEIARVLPDMLAAAVRLERELAGDCAFVIPSASPAMRRLGEAVAATCPTRPARLTFVDGQARQVLRQAQAAAVASGTATLEACLMRCPTVLVYRVPWLTYVLGRLIVRGIKHLGLANILAGRRLMPELLQHELTPANLAAQLKPYLTDAALRASVLAEYDAVNRSLGDGGASDRAATAIRDTLRAKGLA